MYADVLKMEGDDGRITLVPVPTIDEMTINRDLSVPALRTLFTFC